MADDLKTYGDLKKVISSITRNQKIKDIGGGIINIGIEGAIDAAKAIVPGIGTAKTTYDLMKKFISKPDTKKTKTWLDKLDIDDSMSRIIDDTVENGFIQTISKTVESEPDTKPLEQNFNMNQKLVDYLKNQYQGRTITGISENNMKKELLKKIIKEEIAKLRQEANTTPAPPTNQPPQKIQGATLNLKLLKQLNPNIDQNILQTTITAIKGDKALSMSQNKIMADLMVSMIKTSDDALLTQIFQNFKQIEAK